MRNHIALKTVLAALVLTVGLAVSAKDARAVMMYDGSGDCTLGCTGTASWQLTVPDTYTPLTNLTLGDFVNFTYYSNIFTILSGTFAPTSLSGVLPVSGPAAANVTLTGMVGGTLFSLLVTDTAGGWTAQLQTSFDSGDNSTWSKYETRTTVSEPSALLLSLTGFGLLAAGIVVGRRRRRVTA